MLDQLEYFKEFPFKETPPDEIDFWANRHEVKKELEKLITEFKSTRTSKIISVWGVWGNGKSHSLKYIRFFLGDSVEFIYGPFPKDAKNFGSIYKQHFISIFDFRRFANICRKIYISANKSDDWLTKYADIEKSLFHNSIDFSRIVFETGKLFDVRSLQDAFQSEIFGTIVQWLKGEKLSKKQLQNIGVSRSLQNDTDFVNTFSCLIRLFGSDFGEKRLVIWAFDDCQIMEHFTPNAKMLIQQGIRDAFDASQGGLCIIIASASRDIETFDSMLIEDIKSRMSPIRIKLPNFDTENLDEAISFIKDLINHSRFKLEEHTDTWYPFNEQVVRKALRNITQVEGDFTPRKIMKYFNSLVSEAQSNNVEKIDMKFINQYFSKFEDNS